MVPSGLHWVPGLVLFTLLAASPPRLDSLGLAPNPCALVPDLLALGLWVYLHPHLVFLGEKHHLRDYGSVYQRHPYLGK